MRFARFRLLVAAAVLAGWLGWLGYQSLTHGRGQVILSHSQFLTSKVDVVAQVQPGEAGGTAEPRVRVVEVLWPDDQSRLAGRWVRVANLTSARGYQGEGLYIVPLVPGGQSDEFLVAPLPRSPGFVDLPDGPRFIYPATPEARRQLRAIPKFQDRLSGG